MQKHQFITQTIKFSYMPFLCSHSFICTLSKYRKYNIGRSVKWPHRLKASVRINHKIWDVLKMFLHMVWSKDTQAVHFQCQPDHPTGNSFSPRREAYKTFHDKWRWCYTRQPANDSQPSSQKVRVRTTRPNYYLKCYKSQTYANSWTGYLIWFDQLTFDRY